MNPSIATQRYESTSIPLNQGTEPRLGLQITPTKESKHNDSDTTHATTRDVTNNDQCMIQHNSIPDRV